MRVLCITAAYPPHHLGGYEISCAGVMGGLARRGHSVTVLTSRERVDGVVDVPGERTAEPAVRRDLIRYFRDHQLWSPSLPRRWLVERTNQAALRAALEAARPDVLAVWHLGALSIGLVTTVIEAGVPVVYAVSDDWPTYCLQLDAWARAMRRLGPLAAALRPVLGVPTVVGDLGRSGPFCFISANSRDRAVRLGSWTFPDASVVYSGIDRAAFPPRAEAPPWSGRLLYVGRLDQRKGIDTAVRALVHLPAEVSLEVQGTGDPAEQARLERLVADLGLARRVQVARVSRRELPARYQAADVCVFPSEWEEPFGLVPLEAMSSGTPVVATGVGGSGEFLLDRVNCLRFPPGDASALASAVSVLAGDPALRRRLVASGRATAAWFDDGDLTDVFEDWYRYAAERPARPRPADRAFTPANADVSTYEPE